MRRLDWCVYACIVQYSIRSVSITVDSVAIVPDFSLTFQIAALLFLPSYLSWFYDQTNGRWARSGNALGQAVNILEALSAF